MAGTAVEALVDHLAAMVAVRLHNRLCPERHSNSGDCHREASSCLPDRRYMSVKSCIKFLKRLRRKRIRDPRRLSSKRRIKLVLLSTESDSRSSILSSSARDPIRFAKLDCDCSLPCNDFETVVRRFQQHSRIARTLQRRSSGAQLKAGMGDGRKCCRETASDFCTRGYN